MSDIKDVRDFTKPNPDDPKNLADRLMSGGSPINKGIAMMLNAPSVVAGYSCQNCAHETEFRAPIRMTREDIRRACCGHCGSERVTLNCRGGM